MSTHKRELYPRKRHFFLIEKYIEDARQDEKHVPDLLETIIQPPGIFSYRFVFLIEEYFEDVRQDEKHVPDLLESIIQPPALVKEELEWVHWVGMGCRLLEWVGGAGHRVTVTQKGSCT